MVPWYFRAAAASAAASAGAGAGASRLRYRHSRSSTPSSVTPSSVTPPQQFSYGVARWCGGSRLRWYAFAIATAAASAHVGEAATAAASADVAASGAATAAASADVGDAATAATSAVVGDAATSAAASAVVGDVAGDADAVVGDAATAYVSVKSLFRRTTGGFFVRTRFGFAGRVLTSGELLPSLEKTTAYDIVALLPHSANDT